VRVLVIHNRYRLPGGEERAVAETVALLRRHGHEVALLERSSEELTPVRAARALIGGGERPDEVAGEIDRFRPDVVHAHNLHPLFGFKALQAARRAGVRTVLHLHNFRLFCAVGVAYRDGRPCHQCHTRNSLPGLAHRCRGSLPEAAAYAAGLARQQHPLTESADALVALTTAHASRLTAFGLAPHKLTVLTNFLPEHAWAERTRAHTGSYALVAGRLTEEKGIDTAIRAAQRAGVPLVVAGQGPDEERLRALAGDTVRFTGWLAPEELAMLRRDAAFALVPSRWEEVCPYTLLESLAAGLPTLVSDRGGLPELVEHAGGTVLPADDPDAWAAAMRALWADPESRRSPGEAALSTGRQRFGESAYLDRLLEIYAPTTA
jgi:glycosyltransferase involved in cell wall biosynthesis